MELYTVETPIGVFTVHPTEYHWSIYLDGVNIGTAKYFDRALHIIAGRMG